MPEPDAAPDALELQAHAISKALEEKHGVLIEDYWRRGGRAFLKYWPPGGPMWTIALTPHPVQADLSEAQCFQVQEARDALATWDLTHGPAMFDRESVLADHVRALLAIIDAVATACEGGSDGG